MSIFIQGVNGQGKVVCMYVVDYLYVEPWSLGDHSLRTAHVTAAWDTCILYSDGEKNDTAHQSWMYLYFTNTGA